MAKEKSGASRVALLLILFLTVVSFSGCLKEGELSVSTMDVSAERITSSSATINVTTYIENDKGGDSSNVSLLLKATDKDSGLLQLQERRFIGKVKKGSTAIVSQQVVLPRKGSYELEVTLFEGDVKKARGWKTISNLDSLLPNIKSSGIDIPEIDFIVRNTTGSRVIIQSDILFSNEGRQRTPGYKVQVKAKEQDADLIADKGWIDLGGIAPDTTIVKSINLTVPDQYNYIVQVLIWNNATIIKRGEGQVLLRPGEKLAEGEHVETRNIKTSDFVTSAPAKNAVAPSPGFGNKMAPGFDIIQGFLSISCILFIRRLIYGCRS